MLFNSFEFIFIFLPITWLCYHLLLVRGNKELALSSLVIASLAFYGYWNPVYIYLILLSMVGNYIFGRLIIRTNRNLGRVVCTVGISVNLLVLAYFKYANFFVDNFSLLIGKDLLLEAIVLPLAISFFTFQQISYLVDVYRGQAHEYSFMHYALFVCFFPQLIAGPIVHHKEMLPQFMRSFHLDDWKRNLAIGGGIFSIGLFKKTVIADNLSVYVSPVYDAESIAQSIDFFSAWLSTLAYTFQLYFDFSGYSDMAVGCARLFGITLPINFFSPYKAVSIVDFWRRWHITLSRFLRDYLYIPLGGSRVGRVGRYSNLFITMLLGGLWHGAGWNFVIWGGLHGLYLSVNHFWSAMIKKTNVDFQSSSIYLLFCWLLTFLSVAFAWVFFRAPSVVRAKEILLAMVGGYGFSIPEGLGVRLGECGVMLRAVGVTFDSSSGSHFASAVVAIMAGSCVSFLFPNVYQFYEKFSPVLYERDDAFCEQRSFSKRFLWKPSVFNAALTAVFLVFGFLTLMQVSEFLYFRF